MKFHENIRERFDKNFTNVLLNLFYFFEVHNSVLWLCFSFFCSHGKDI